MPASSSRAVALEILRHRQAEQLGEKVIGDVGLALRQQGRGRVEQRHAGIVVACCGEYPGRSCFPYLAQFCGDITRAWGVPATAPQRHFTHLI